MKTKAKLKFLILILCVILITCISITSVRIAKHFPAVASRYCDQVIVREISRIINSQMLSIYNQNFSKDVLVIEKDEYGNVTFIDINAQYVNMIKSELTLEIIKMLTEYDNLNFGIPLGNAMNSYTLSGLGPKIPVKAVPVGSVVSKIKSSLVSGGVNQTKYELYIEFITCVEISGPLFTETREIRSELCIAQTIIVGKVPGIVWGIDN